MFSTSAVEMCCIDDFWVSNDSVFINSFWFSWSLYALAIYVELGVSSESVFATESWCLQWISFRCRKLLNNGICSELDFTVESWCLQQISFRCRKLPNNGVCSKSVFTTELWCLQQISFRSWIVLSTANQFSLLNFNVYSKSFFTAELRVASE